MQRTIYYLLLHVLVPISAFSQAEEILNQVSYDFQNKIIYDPMFVSFIHESGLTESPKFIYMDSLICTETKLNHFLRVFTITPHDSVYFFEDPKMKDAKTREIEYYIPDTLSFLKNLSYSEYRLIDSVKSLFLIMSKPLVSEDCIYVELQLLNSIINERSILRYMLIYNSKLNLTYIWRTHIYDETKSSIRFCREPDNNAFCN